MPLKTVHPSIFEKDLYRLLEVAPNASLSVLSAAYKTLMVKYAPRASGDDEKMATLLGAAHAVLSDTKERRRYDDYCARRRADSSLIGPYKVLKQVAVGGFGPTYKAEHTIVGDFSCLKTCSEISAQAEEVLLQETRSIWNLRHYGLPIMRDLLKRDDGSLVLAMSWIEGPTLEQIVEKNGKLDPENVAWMTERVLNTLSYLHHHGVIHGDIKPQNIIVQPDTHIVVLVDFGLSSIKPKAGGGNKGYTEIFSPPEQVNGSTIVPGSDFYSLGMTMLYALGGGLKAVERKEVPVNVPDPLCDFTRKLIVRSVLERPRDAGQLFEEFIRARSESFGRSHSNLKQLEV